MKLLALLALSMLAACSSSQPSKPASQDLSSRLARLNPFATSSLPTLLVHASGVHSTGNSATTPPIDTTNADFLAVAVSGGFNTNQQTITDSKNNTCWIALTPPHGPNSNLGTNIQLFYCYSPTVGTGHTFTTTSPVASYQSIAIAAFSGMSGGSFDAQSGATHQAAAGIYPAGSVTPPTGRQNELIISAIANLSLTADSVNSGLTLIEHQNFVSGPNYGISLAYVVQAAPASINPAWTIPAPQGGQGGEVVAAFSPNPGPPPPPTPTQTITSGSSALPTSSIPAGACDVTIFNVSAPGALATDNGDVTPTSNAATAGYGPKGFSFSWWINSNSISFARCNAAATAQAPGPLTVNWRILR